MKVSADSTVFMQGKYSNNKKPHKAYTDKNTLLLRPPYISTCPVPKEEYLRETHFVDSFFKPFNVFSTHWMLFVMDSK